MDQTIETVILNNLIHNDDFCRSVVPFLKSEYFKDRNDKILYELIMEYVGKYNKTPSKEALEINLQKMENISEDQYRGCSDFISNSKEIDCNLEWLLDESERFCKDKAIYNAVLDSIHIIDGKSKDKSVDALPEILSDALAVSFDNNVGHDFLEQAGNRFDFYHRKEKKIAFDLEFFNTITNGGTPSKTLNIVMAGTGVGKSMFLCHHAANCLVQNKNVLYITCEMAEERIAERIDANIMDITMDNLQELSKDMYMKKLKSSTVGVSGKLIVKEYPTATANVNHFRGLLNELLLKKKFKPDVVFVDYLNICASARLKQGGSTNSYLYIKAIAEELRGLAVENDIPIFSATQTNRTGYSNTDVGLEDTSESFGLPATADFMFALISTEELEELGQILVKQLKNRYNDAFSNKKFIVGVNRGKMKLFDVNRTDQDNLLDSNQTEETKLGSGFNMESFDEKFKTDTSKFEGWKIG